MSFNLSHLLSNDYDDVANALGQVRNKAGGQNLVIDMCETPWCDSLSRRLMSGVGDATSNKHGRIGRYT